MNKKVTYTLSAIILILLIFIGYREFSTNNHHAVMAVTGATPVAYRQAVPPDASLEVTGMLEKNYTFDNDALNALAPTYIRTREVTPEGKFMGTYRYHGIPILHVLEGIPVKKPEDAAFDAPHDIVVTFINADGKESRFSYGELTMTTDSLPVTLAYNREQLLPSKEPEKYNKNVHTENIEGLRLVCPRDGETSRYLDRVVKMTLTVPYAQSSLLPKTRKGLKCASSGISRIIGEKSMPVTYSGVSSASYDEWIRVGHGRGYKGISKAAGYDLRSFLKKNFPGCGRESWFLFTACDGYRCLFSGREIFEHEAGKNMMIITSLDGKPHKGGPMLGPVTDFYVDRDVWGLTHVMIIKDIK